MAERAEEDLVTDTFRTPEEHRKRHVELHHEFDELMADFLAHNRGKLPSNTTLTELMEWSHAQTLEPTERKE